VRENGERFQEQVTKNCRGGLWGRTRKILGKKKKDATASIKEGQGENTGKEVVGGTFVRGWCPPAKARPPKFRKTKKKTG